MGRGLKYIAGTVIPYGVAGSAIVSGGYLVYAGISERYMPAVDIGVKLITLGTATAAVRALAGACHWQEEVSAEGEQLVETLDKSNAQTGRWLKSQRTSHCGLEKI